ncbi:S1 family peptidase [Azospirillum lipoferum]|uniref:Inactive STAND domain-containing protein n=1 Tax=Azospirillum lipoferum (strain 4B) TaxID=862719 RepID=G7ZD83_AZOL4|nr:serine protease [Azospirillum lipoferum]CBS89362.1 protein of unknown function [Azospirillum lipoferum 4B]
MERERVVEVYVEEENDGYGYGSGYLITDRLVLTARHVAKLSGAACEIAVLGTAPANGGTGPKLLAARVVWVSPSHDVALVAVDEPVAGLPRAPVRFGKVDLNDRADRCYGIGFPDAQRRQDGNADRLIQAALSWVSKDGLFNADVLNAAPDQEIGWKGFSGTALFVEDALVAVVEAVPPNFAGRVLTATSVASFCDDAGFRECLRSHGAAPPILERVDGSFPTGLTESIAYNVCFVDRIPQVEMIVTAVTDHGSADGRPRLFLIPGEPDDDHARVIERLAREDQMQRFLGRDTDPGDAIIEIHWPQAPVIDAAAAFRNMLCRDLTNALCLPPEAATAASLRQAMDRPDAPRAFWTRISAGRAGPGHGELLRSWLGLWSELAALPGRNTVLLLLCLITGEQMPARKPPLPFMRPPPPVDPDPLLQQVLEEAVTGNRLPWVDPLSPIEHGHVRDWLDRIRPRCRQVRREQIDFLRMRIERRLTSAVSMRAFCDHLTEVLESPL